MTSPFRPLVLIAEDPASRPHLKPAWRPTSHHLTEALWVIFTSVESRLGYHMWKFRSLSLFISQEKISMEVSGLSKHDNIRSSWMENESAIAKHILSHQTVVTCLCLTSRYVLVALDDASIRFFTLDGKYHSVLTDNVSTVWAMASLENRLISGGLDGNVRVWNLETEKRIQNMSGHTSTVRCLKLAGDSKTAISGSRDGTIRIWDIETAVCKHVLEGHDATVRCLDVHGNIIVSGSFDGQCKIWSMSDGRCWNTLKGHTSQIYAIAFDGISIATGSLDCNVRVWNVTSGICTAVLQGHTSLVSHVQMRGATLVSGGADGQIRVWSLEDMTTTYCLAAHENAVTTLQFDENYIVSGGSDGRTRVWDFETGRLVRELANPAEAVYNVGFDKEKAVIIVTSRQNQMTVLEVWSFSSPKETAAGASEKLSRLVV